jgi:hypothetical protein
VLRLCSRRRWPGLSLGIGLPLLLGSTPAAAAGASGFAITGVTTGIGVLAAVWALFAAGGMPIATGSLAALAFAVLTLGSGVWVWRRQVGRAAMPAKPDGTRSLVARRAEPAFPPGLDGEQVLAEARGRFLGLQAAWDAGDVGTLQALTTPEMLDELMLVLAARQTSRSRTDVISLHAELLDLEELGAAWLASIEFSGLIRESAEQGPVPFRELWMLASTKDGAPSWRLARQQALL